MNDYQAGYPINLGAQGAHSVTIADLSSASPGEEMVVGTSKGLKCFDADGDLVWARDASHHGDFAGFVNGTPLVAPIYKTDKLYCLHLDSLLYVLDGENGQPVDTVQLEGAYIGLGPPRSNQAQAMIVVDVVTDDSSLEIIVRERRNILPNPGLYLRCYQLSGETDLLWE